MSAVQMLVGFPTFEHERLAGDTPALGTTSDWFAIQLRTGVGSQFQQGNGPILMRLLDQHFLEGLRWSGGGG